jgi:hypothetical protein
MAELKVDWSVEKSVQLKVSLTAMLKEKNWVGMLELLMDV